MGFVALAGVATLWRMIVHGGDSQWEYISEVRDQPLHRKLRGREVIVPALSDGRSGTLLSDTVTPDSDTLRDWVRFYWRHPGYRTELTDGRALQRLDEENFDAE